MKVWYSFQHMVLEKLNIHVQKKKIKKQKTNQDTDFILFTKLCLKQILGLNIKHTTIKLLEDNIGEILDDLGYGDEFLDATPSHDP